MFSNKRKVAFLKAISEGETASSGPNGQNLLTEALEHDAKIAVGFEYKIAHPSANLWTKDFLNGLANGESVGGLWQRLRMDNGEDAETDDDPDTVRFTWATAIGDVSRTLC